MSGIVIAGTHSGCGKTTITLGIMAALKKKGFSIQPFKTGPDFIDAGLHRLISGRPSINLDIWMCGKNYVRNCFCRYSSQADISVVEGVMGFYDGELSTARLAEVLNLPVILVVDAYGMAESAGAIVKGFMEYKNQNLIRGIIFNRVASERHFIRLKNSVRSVEVFGYLPRDIKFEIPRRHLGLVVAEENPITTEVIERLADSVLEHVDMKIIEQQSSRTKIDEAVNRLTNYQFIPSPIPFTNSPTIAVAYDKAFCFYYEDNLDLLRKAGAEIVRFSPLMDEAIPEADALYIGGGYPELYAERLSQNRPMLKAIYKWASSGGPIYAECGGLMYLSQGIHDTDGNFFQMAGVLSFETRMRRKNFSLGYREVELTDECILGMKGNVLRGHEFHYSEILNHKGSALADVYLVRDDHGRSINASGYKLRNTLASYIHIHFGSNAATWERTGMRMGGSIAENFINFIKRC